MSLGVDLENRIYKCLKLLNNSSLHSKEKNWLTLKYKFIYLSPHMNACPSIHTHNFHLHHFYSFLLTLPTPLRSRGFSFPATSTGEVYVPLSEGTVHRSHTVDLITPHKILCKK